MTAESNVVTIYGNGCDPRKASADVVDALEVALDRARAGEIVGIVIAGLHYDKSTGRVIAGQATDSALVGCLCKVLNELSRDS
jgi:hypothetical protein